MPDLLWRLRVALMIGLGLAGFQFRHLVAFA